MNAGEVIETFRRAVHFEQEPKPMIQCCFASDWGVPLSGSEWKSYELPDLPRCLFFWPGIPDSVPEGKGIACVQLNRAARGLHYAIRDVQVSGVTQFLGVSTTVLLGMYNEGTIIADVHRLRPEPGGMRLQDILNWLLSEYLLEFDGYDRLTFIDWIVSNLHLSTAELGGAEALEDWYRMRARDISEQGQPDDT